VVIGGYVEYSISDGQNEITESRILFTAHVINSLVSVTLLYRIIKYIY